MKFEIQRANEKRKGKKIKKKINLDAKFQFNLAEGEVNFIA